MSKRKQQIRASFRDAVYQRDGYSCVMCKKSEEEVGHLDAHHITDRNEMPNGGYVPENGISLCPECHIKAEEWHSSNHTSYTPGYHPEELYERIKSSYESAVRASQKLS